MSMFIKDAEFNLENRYEIINLEVLQWSTGNAPCLLVKNMLYNEFELIIASFCTKNNQVQYYQKHKGHAF